MLLASSVLVRTYLTIRRGWLWLKIANPLSRVVRAMFLHVSLLQVQSLKLIELYYAIMLSRKSFDTLLFPVIQILCCESLGASSLALLVV